MANEFDNDFTGFDAVSYDRYQAERDYEDSLDSVGGDFEGQIFNREDFLHNCDEQGDMMQDDFESDFEEPYGLDPVDYEPDYCMDFMGEP